MYQKKKKKRKAQLMKVGQKVEICLRKNHNLLTYGLIEF